MGPDARFSAWCQLNHNWLNYSLNKFAYPTISGALLSGFLNHCNGAEGTLDSGDLLQIQTLLSGKGGNRGKPDPGTIPPMKQANKWGAEELFLCIQLIKVSNLSFLLI